MNHTVRRGALAVALWGIVLGGLASAAVDPEVLAAEQQRVDAMAKATRPSIAIFAGSQGGGSGVIISPDGYALSNFHVTSPAGVAMKCGLSDGGYYDAVLVGLDPTGDVALIKLLGRTDFPAAELGDSDEVRQGDWVFAIGNPFLLATNLQPSISYGIVSGVHRYQYPAGTILEYADCIQTDAAINPGNSGGPLFNSRGQLIGINGRGSFEKRGRVNVGVGYAITINQIKHFLPHLRSGRIVDHATLGATVARDDDGGVHVSDILEDSDAYRQGLRYDDEILRLADRRITSANTFKNVLGTLPKDARVPLEYRRADRELTMLVQLAGVHRSGELEEMVAGESQDRPQPPGDTPPDGAPPVPQTPQKKGPQIPDAVQPYYEARTGYANYHFNRLERERVWNNFRALGDFSTLAGTWTLQGNLPLGGDVKIELGDKACACSVPAGDFAFELGDNWSQTLDPPQSGGMLVALSLWRRLLIKGPAQFGDVSYLGAVALDDWTVQYDVFVGLYAGVEARYYFHPTTGELAALEFYPTEDATPCRLRFSKYLDFQGRKWPTMLSISTGATGFADVILKTFDAKTAEGGGA